MFAGDYYLAERRRAMNRFSEAVYWVVVFLLVAIVYRLTIM